MLILIKDLDFFCSKYSGPKAILEYSEVVLQDVLNFVFDIANSLIKKLQKDKQLKFTIEKLNTLPCIVNTDEMKLKQIIINLVSNAIKYTNNGSVVLSVQENRNKICSL